MPSSLLRLAALALAAGCSASATPGKDGAPADAPPTGPGTLAVESRLPATFASVSNVVEVGGGRIAFADPRDRHLLAADLASGAVDTLGARVETVDATTAGYKLPGWVARLAGDTLALVDFAAVRTTLWSPTGAFVRALPLPAVGGPTPVLVYDGVGHAYKADFTGVLGGSEPGTEVRRDSIVVLRIALATGAVDTVARLSGPEFGMARVGEQMQEVARVFGPTDNFGATPDGRVWVARARTHSVDWRATDGTWTRGAKHAYQAVPVTPADRERVMTRLRERGLPTGVEVEFPFAETKPSFEQALGRPNGEVWLQYSRGTEDEPVRYAVFDAKGSFRRDVTAPAGVTVAGFGDSGAIYGTVREADGRRGVARLTVSP
ncbi:MAG TPA: hypothetical protein VFX50_09680 [Gemmatimonadales bacterium]|nr:hypothetical protein [Gemmatimonadales bacterium]